MTAMPARPSAAPLQDFACLVQAEFKEMPGMRLTFAQARRLWNLSTEECTLVFAYLLNAGVVVKDKDHRFCRLES